MSNISSGSLTVVDRSQERATQQHFWFNAVSDTLESGAYITNTAIDTFKNGKSGGYALIRNDKLVFAHGNNKFVELIADGTNNALNFYQPPTIGTVTNQGQKTMSLARDALTFYNPNDGITSLAVLNANGLTLSKGGIVAGQALTDKFVYLSTEDYPLRQYIKTSDNPIVSTKTYYTYNSETQRYNLVITPDDSERDNYYEISNQGLTINGHTPGDATNDSPWRQIIGSKFGVDASGTLYAAGAVFDENIQIGSLSGTTLNRISLDGDALIIQNRLGTTIASYGQTVIIGNKDEGQSYIEITNQGISFYGTGQPENPSASINGQYMYIPYTVVLNEMQVGQYTDETTGKERSLWSWKKMDNKNLRLVWLGGNS